MTTKTLTEQIALANWSGEYDTADVHFHYDVDAWNEPADSEVGYDGGMVCTAKLIGATVTIENYGKKIVLAVPREDIINLYGAARVSKAEDGAAEDYAYNND